MHPEHALSFQPGGNPDGLPVRFLSPAGSGKG
jgi:hypothetical protein